MFTKDNRGFSLIELMVAVSLVGIISLTASTTFDVVIHGKNEADKAKFLTETRSSLESLLKDPRFAEKQPEIFSCMKLGTEGSRKACYKKANLVKMTRSRQIKLAGYLENISDLGKDSRKNSKYHRLSGQECNTPLKGNCLIAVSYTVTDYCEFSPISNTSKCKGEATSAEIVITYDQWDGRQFTPLLRSVTNIHTGVVENLTRESKHHELNLASCDPNFYTVGLARNQEFLSYDINRGQCSEFSMIDIVNAGNDFPVNGREGYKGLTGPQGPQGAPGCSGWTPPSNGDIKVVKKIKRRVKRKVKIKNGKKIVKKKKIRKEKVLVFEDGVLVEKTKNVRRKEDKNVSEKILKDSDRTVVRERDKKKKKKITTEGDMVTKNEHKKKKQKKTAETDGEKYVDKKRKNIKRDVVKTPDVREVDQKIKRKNG